jgi:hypothetical protein
MRFSRSRRDASTTVEPPPLVVFLFPYFAIYAASLLLDTLFTADFLADAIYSVLIAVLVVVTVLCGAFDVAYVVCGRGRRFVFLVLTTSLLFSFVEVFFAVRTAHW